MQKTKKKIRDKKSKGDAIEKKNKKHTRSLTKSHRSKVEHTLAAAHA